MLRGRNPLFSITPNSVVFHAAFVGASTADMTLATAAQYPRQSNLGLTCVRTSIGLYVVTLADGPPRMLSVIPLLIGTTVLSAKVKVAYLASARTMTLNIFDGAGSLADPTTADTLVLRMSGQDSTA